MHMLISQFIIMICYAAYLVTSHFYNKCHQHLLTVITLCLPKMTKLSFTDKLRTHMLTCNGTPIDAK